jgi:hypothetical protein
MLIPAGDQELLARQEALQAEAGQVLAELPARVNDRAGGPGGG